MDKAEDKTILFYTAKLSFLLEKGKLSGIQRHQGCLCFKSKGSVSAIQLMAKLGSLELCGLNDAQITTTSAWSSRQSHQFSNKLGKNVPAN